MTRQHVVIRREEYVAATREKPEVGLFTQTHVGRPPVPWDRIAVGEPVWMKWSAGPVVARARVQGFRQLEHTTPGQLRETSTGFMLYDLKDYWESRPPVFFGMTVYLDGEEWLDNPFYPGGRSFGQSWIVVDSPALEALWLTPTAAATTGTEPDTAASGRGSRTASPSLRFAVLRRDGFACTYCGRKPPEARLQADHIVAWSAGGRTVLDNLRTACTECNLGKGSRHL